jgi:hypothetical protein
LLHSRLARRDFFPFPDSGPDERPICTQQQFDCLHNRLLTWLHPLIYFKLFSCLLTSRINSFVSLTPVDFIPINLVVNVVERPPLQFSCSTKKWSPYVRPFPDSLSTMCQPSKPSRTLFRRFSAAGRSDTYFIVRLSVSANLCLINMINKFRIATCVIRGNVDSGSVLGVRARRSPV